MKKLISIIFIIFIYSIPQVFATPLPENRSGGWVLSDGKFRHADPTGIQYQIVEDISIDIYFNNSKMRSLFKQAMKIWEQIANVHFIQTKRQGLAIVKAPIRASGTQSMATCFTGAQSKKYEGIPACINPYNYTGAIRINIDVNLIIIDIKRTVKDFNQPLTNSNREKVVLNIIIHELGHVLGLDHILDINRTKKGINILTSSQYDTYVSSIMFGNLVDFKVKGGRWESIDTPSRADRIALIKMYGASPVYTSYLANNTAKATALRDEL